MKLPFYIVGIALALLVGTLLGRALFPKPSALPSPAAVAGSGASPQVSALPIASPPTPKAALNAVVNARTATNTDRAMFIALQKVRAMSDAEIITLAEGLVTDKVALTQYESSFLSEIWTRFAAIDPQRAQQLALQLQTRVMRQNASAIANQAWALADPAAALAEAIGASANLEISSLGTVIKVLVERDPAEAIAAIEAHREATWYTQARGSLFQSWSKNDADGARAWLLEQMDSNPSDSDRILRDLAKVDPQGTLAIALGMEPTAALRMAVGDIINGQWRWLDREAAIGALRDLPDQWHSQRLADSFGRNGVTKTPLDQLDSYAEMFPTPELRTAFWYSSLGRRAYDGKFTEAVSLLPKLPAGEERGHGAAQIAGAWSKRNPAEASAWLSELAPGIERDHAVEAFVSAIAPLDAESARQWADSIADAELQKRARKALK